MTDIVLSAADRELCNLAAQLLMNAADPGQERESRGIAFIAPD
jgi:hypothetical protein